MHTRSRRKSAFTLIELLIVITIIGILAAALLPRITGGPSRARDAQRKADLQQIATALEFYADDHAGKYPLTGGGNCVSDMTDEALALNPLADYLTTLPADPQDKDSGPCAAGYTYGRMDSPNGTSYLLSAALESTTASGPGHYQTDFVFIPITDTYAERLTGNSANLCDGALDCSAGIFYVTGR